MTKWWLKLFPGIGQPPCSWWIPLHNRIRPAVAGCGWRWRNHRRGGRRGSEGRSGPRQKANETIGKTMFCDNGENTSQTLIKPVVSWLFWRTFCKKVPKSIGKPLRLQAFCGALSRCWKPFIFIGKTWYFAYCKVPYPNPYKTCCFLIILTYLLQKGT